ncbi:unnamed protein product, partial [Urochloa humidicola]
SFQSSLPFLSSTRLSPWISSMAMAPSLAPAPPASPVATTAGAAPPATASLPTCPPTTTGPPPTAAPATTAPPPTAGPPATAAGASPPMTTTVPTVTAACSAIPPASRPDRGTEPSHATSQADLGAEAPTGVPPLLLGPPPPLPLLPGATEDVEQLLNERLALSSGLNVEQNIQNAFEVSAWHEDHTCTSSMRRKTTTPSAKWVASKAITILKQTPDMGPRDMQIKLQDDHNCVIGYDTV